MNDIPPWVLDIEKESGAKRVLIVEGEDDRRIVEKWLSILEAGFRGNLYVHEAKGRDRVQQALRHRPGWFGLEDRDEWTDTEIQGLQSEYPTLRFLPRYCIENYFLVPGEVWPLIPPAQQAKYPGGQTRFQVDIHSKVDQYVPHWCMWVVLRVRRRELLETLKFPNALIDRMLNKPPITEHDIRAQLQTWNNQMDAAIIFREYQDLLSQVSGKTADEKLTHHVHGKVFFARVMVREVFRNILQNNAQAWLSDLTMEIKSVPPDIESILSDYLV